ncbi:MAG: hypothetical protein IJ638_03505, partial [Alphaproteobacteria bacterium]|nr:hypothetical protein [Alphaproteobacteria bacterium]
KELKKIILIEKKEALLRDLAYKKNYDIRRGVNRLKEKDLSKEREIFNCKEEIKFLKNNQKIKSNTESYLNNLERKILPQIEKEILTQQFYINLFSKEGR